MRSTDDFNGLIAEWNSMLYPGLRSLRRNDRDPINNVVLESGDICHAEGDVCAARFLRSAPGALRSQ